MTQDNFPQFPAYACEGDKINWTKNGFDFVARIAHDYDSKPSGSDCHTPEQITSWERDEWFFCGVVVAVSFKGIELDRHAASLWGIECNFGPNNAYLSEVAQELESEALEVAKKELFRIRELLKVQA
jgi:hypothetical protein